MHSLLRSPVVPIKPSSVAEAQAIAQIVINESRTREGAPACAHGERRSACLDCCGLRICSHGRRKSECKVCAGPRVCDHGKRRRQCNQCLTRLGMHRNTCFSTGSDGSNGLPAAIQLPAVMTAVHDKRASTSSFPTTNPLFVDPSLTNVSVAASYYVKANDLSSDLSDVAAAVTTAGGIACTATAAVDALRDSLLSPARNVLSEHVASADALHAHLKAASFILKASHYPQVN